MTLREKLERLKTRLRRDRRLAVAFSGGIDSMLLLRLAADCLGPDAVVAVTAKGRNFPRRELEEAEAFARELGVRHAFLDFDALAIPEFVANSPERCYHCKKALMEAVIATARELDCPTVADGANHDDAGDHRPGMRAAAELGVISPLREAEIGKQEIRELLREHGVRDWRKPSCACLASRIPYGQAIDAASLDLVGRAEDYFFDLGFENVRVRLHGDVARVEVDPAERERFFDAAFMDQVGGALRDLGIQYAALDFLGYRSGSMNEAIGQP